MKIEECLKIAEDMDFYVDYETKYMQQFTPLGEDWNIDFSNCNNGYEFVECLKSYVNSVDEDTVMYIENRGQHGIPESTQQLLEDGEWKKKTLQDLIEQITGNKNIKNKLETILSYAKKIDEIWWEIKEEDRLKFDEEFNEPISSHIRWLLTDVEDILENDLKDE